MGTKRTLLNTVAVRQRAVASDGEHFSFEKLDCVTRTTIRGRFAGCVSEQEYHRNALVSFALTEEAVCEAYAATLGGADEAVESDADEERTVSERTAATKAAAAEHHESVSRKREAGKARQAAAAANTAAKRAALKPPRP